MAARRWRRRANVKRPRSPRRKTGIAIGPELQPVVRNLVEEAYPETGRAVEVEMEKLRTETVRTWPVKTGFSKSTIDLVHRIEGDTYKTSLVVRAWYSIFIRSKGKQPAVEVLRQAVPLSAKLAERIAKRVSS